MIGSGRATSAIGLVALREPQGERLASFVRGQPLPQSSPADGGGRVGIRVEFYGPIVHPRRRSAGTALRQAHGERSAGSAGPSALPPPQTGEEVQRGTAPHGVARLKDSSMTEGRSSGSAKDESK